MKTPDEIKKGLQHCKGANPCADCTYDRRDFPQCIIRLQSDALSLVQQLEVELTSVKRERDAAKNDLYSCQPCFACSHFRHNGGACRGSNDCHEKMGECAVECIEYVGISFMWRGVCPENTEEQVNE